jgi:hypothetical protein
VTRWVIRNVSDTSAQLSLCAMRRSQPFLAPCQHIIHLCFLCGFFCSVSRVPALCLGAVGRGRRVHCRQVGKLIMRPSVMQRVERILRVCGWLVSDWWVFHSISDKGTNRSAALAARQCTVAGRGCEWWEEGK